MTKMKNELKVVELRIIPMIIPLKVRLSKGHTRVGSEEGRRLEEREKKAHRFKFSRQSFFIEYPLPIRLYIL